MHKQYNNYYILLKKTLQKNDNCDIENDFFEKIQNPFLKKVTLEKYLKKNFFYSETQQKLSKKDSSIVKFSLNSPVKTKEKINDFFLFNFLRKSPIEKILNSSRHKKGDF